MIRLVYSSRARPGVDDTTAEMILACSRRNNAAAGVTGLLVFDGGRFLQALEGDAGIVGTTFARIRADPRHEDCIVLDHGPVATRVFGAWDMAWRRVLRFEEPAALGRMVDELTGTIPDAALADVFGRFARADVTSSRTRP